MPLAGIQLAGLGIGFQGIDIEEGFAVQSHAGEHAVVQGPFHHVRVFGLGVEGKHAAQEEHKADGRAGFGIGGVAGQIVIEGEGLPVVGGADAAGDIHAPVGDGGE